jgi:hypothetical protein
MHIDAWAKFWIYLDLEVLLMHGLEHLQCKSLHCPCKPEGAQEFAGLQGELPEIFFTWHHQVVVKGPLRAQIVCQM